MRSLLERGVTKSTWKLGKQIIFIKFTFEGGILEEDGDDDDNRQLLLT